jgi:hypothetical protein
VPNACNHPYHLHCLQSGKPETSKMKITRYMLFLLEANCFGRGGKDTRRRVDSGT